MLKIKLDKYFAPYSIITALQEGYLEKDEEGLLLDMSDLPEEYEVIVRPIHNKRKYQIIYQNFKERE